MILLVKGIRQKNFKSAWYGTEGTQGRQQLTLSKDGKSRSTDHTKMSTKCQFSMAQPKR